LKFNLRKITPLVLALLVIFSIVRYFDVETHIKTWRANSEDNKPRYIVEFSLQDLDGKTRSISEWSDRRVLINFWATWCVPCRREMPMLQNLYLNKDTHNIEIIGIAVDQNEPVRDFINEYGIEFPILIGQSNAYEIMQQLGNTATTLPYTLVVEPDGLITWYKNTELKAEDLPAILGY
tara:strand:+ start:101 stop:637 length:537 start_codon:yes stop_codon:yes gene_type:complete